MNFHGRKDGSFWLTLLGLQFSGQFARWSGGPGANINWGMGYTEGIGFSVRCLYGFWFTWKLPWKVMRRLPGWPMDGSREFGVSWLDGWARFTFAADPHGTHWGHLGKGPRAALRKAWRNREIVFWRNTWIVGRDRYQTEVLDERPLMIDARRWPGDSYLATQKIERSTWRNRFRTKTHVSYWWDIPSGSPGIPTDTKGKWGDRYDTTFGFGSNALDTESLPNLIELAPAALNTRLASLLRNWPVGLIAEQEVPA
jgi:hypothetical protein